MSNLKIDEQHISQLCTNLTLLMKDIVRDIESVENKDNDVFSRYMSLVRLSAMFKGARDGLNMAHHLFTMGFDVQHEYFQTKAAKENGWDKACIEGNPFFINDDDNLVGRIKLDFSNIPDSLKETIVKAIKEKFSVKKEEMTH